MVILYVAGPPHTNTRSHPAFVVHIMVSLVEKNIRWFKKGLIETQENGFCDSSSQLLRNIKYAVLESFFLIG